MLSHNGLDNAFLPLDAKSVALLHFCTCLSDFQKSFISSMTPLKTNYEGTSAKKSLL